MIIKQQKQVECDHCKTQITLREYEGLEGSWYTDHNCEAGRRAKSEEMKK